MSNPDHPLTGIRVLDLTQIYNGPYATFLMAMAGADVIKVEPPGGEHLRRRNARGGALYPFKMLNPNKRSILLDLKNEEEACKLIYDAIKHSGYKAGKDFVLGLDIAAGELFKNNKYVLASQKKPLDLISFPNF